MELRKPEDPIRMNKIVNSHHKVKTTSNIIKYETGGKVNKKDTFLSHNEGDKINNCVTQF
jgi:hypothetical protein